MLDYLDRRSLPACSNNPIQKARLGILLQSNIELVLTQYSQVRLRSDKASTTVPFRVVYFSALGELHFWVPVKGTPTMINSQDTTANIRLYSRLIPSKNCKRSLKRRGKRIEASLSKAQSVYAPSK